MTAPDPAREAADRAAFERWHFGPDAAVGAETYEREDRLRERAFLAGAAHGRAEAQKDRMFDAEQDMYRIGNLRADLATARSELERATGARDRAEWECDTWKTASANFEAELVRVRAELAQSESNAETLRALTRRLGDERDKARLADPSHPAYALGLAHAYATPAATPPSPPAALRDRVVETGMHLSRLRARLDAGESVDGLTDANRAHQDACDALDAATPKPSVAVAEAAGRLRALCSRWPDHKDIWVANADLRAVLDALGEKGQP